MFLMLRVTIILKSLIGKEELLLGTSRKIQT